MLNISFYRSDQGHPEMKEYASADHFVTAQLREVPDLQDFYKIISVSLEGKDLSDFQGKTIGQLFDYLDR
ncbi:hypothetical protein ACMZ62_04685 [Streptococcus pluranimalium]|uniref:hypothetical protein n=1 Tax=Streptococcus hyovaginalis TaxID=149015 RepID=UPI003AE9AF85